MEPELQAPSFPHPPILAERRLELLTTTNQPALARQALHRLSQMSEGFKPS